MPAEVSSNLARFDGIRYSSINDYSNLHDIYFKTRGKGFGAEVRRRIVLGTYVLSSGYYDAYYKKAQQVRRLIAKEFSKVFEEVDFASRLKAVLRIPGTGMLIESRQRCDAL